MADTGESPLRQEDLFAFLKGYSPPAKQRGEKDLLAGRWRILPNQPLQELSSGSARAYAVRDEKTPNASLYALVFDESATLRQKHIHALKTYRHPSLISLLAEGIAVVGTNAHYIVVLEKPAGELLSDILARKDNPVPETKLVQQYLRPLSEIALAFSKLGISHNRIHPGNIYVTGNAIALGECISEPSGFSQNYVFEPIERILTSPRAKADFVPGADFYALALLALHLTLGFAPFDHANKDLLIRSLLNTGAYHTLIAPYDIPSGLQDFIRGMLGDTRRDRWDAATLSSWLSGRRFNLIMPSPANETSRGFEFAGEAHFSRKSLAHGLWRHWKDAMPLLESHRIERWLKTHIHRQDLADTVTKITQTGTPLTPQQEEEALARVIILLDPAGPLRFRNISIAVEAVGAQLAYALIAERREDLQAMTQILDMDLPGFWIEQQKASPEWTALAAKLQKARSHMRMKGQGFGLERCIYDLNSGLPCLSPMLKGHPVTTLAEMLAALDAIAPQKAANDDVGDAHISAFTASRLDLKKEIQLPELHGKPAPKTRSSLMMLQMLTQAQSKSAEQSYKGISHWLGLKLIPVLEALHNRPRKRKLQTDLGAAISKGALEAITDLLLTPTTFDGDRRGFQTASSDYNTLKKRFKALSGTEGISHVAGMKGLGVAQSVAYGICLATVYATLKSYFHL